MKNQGDGFMRSLRHPIRSIREPFGTAGLIVAVVALIAAVGGTAYAAAKLNSTQKKEVEKIAKKYAGKNGKDGANGANGANGAPGAKGDKGDPGSPGAPGTSAEGTPFSGPKTVGTVTCTEGGVEVISAKPATAVCNGKKGATGFTETLPSGKTEKGTWAMSLGATSGVQSVAPISFTIPLAAPGVSEASAFAFNKKKTEEGEFGTSGCTGSVVNPTAPPGKLCIYTGFEESEHAGTSYQPRISDSSETLNTYGVSGATLLGPFIVGEPTEPAFLTAWGSWAVTAP